MAYPRNPQCKATDEAEDTRINAICKLSVSIVGIIAVIVAYALYLTLTPTPQDGILFGTVMAVIGVLTGVNVPPMLKLIGKRRN